jgi:acylphosphatase
MKKKITFKELMLHTLLDFFEFSAHTTGSLDDEYELDEIGINFFVGFNVDSVLNDLKEKKISKVILAHTHPLLNDESLIFEKNKIDPRILIAYGVLPLPLGNPPTAGDVEFLDKIKNKANFLEIKGAVFSASGIWVFGIINGQKPNIEKLEERIKNKNQSKINDFLEIELIKIKFPDYFMDVEVPGISKAEIDKVLFKSEIEKLKTRPVSENNFLDYKEEIEKLKSFYLNCGVFLDFFYYKDFNIDPIIEMRKIIEKWAEIYL